MEHIQAAANRAAQHAKTLRDGQAPHQQALAADLETLSSAVTDAPTLTTLKAVQDELDLANTTIEGMKSQLTKAREERDQAIKDHAFVVKERDDALAQIETLNQSIVELQGDLEAAKKPDTSLGAHSTKGESHAELKKQAKGGKH